MVNMRMQLKFWKKNYVLMWKNFSARPYFQKICVHPCNNKITVMKVSSSSSFVKFNAKTIKSKLNLHYTRGTAPKRVSSGGDHLCGLARAQHSSEKTSRQLRAVGDIASDITDS